MAIQDHNLSPNSKSARHDLVVQPVTAINQTATVIYSFTPGFSFQVVRVRSFCATKAGVVTANVKVGARVAAPVVFTAATEVGAVLSTTLANLKGSASEAITVELTTDGSGALTFPSITLVFRPFPMNLEANQGP